MLRELHISNLAVIADARIDLSAGLNCFTGTTGAGKSLIIGALEVLLGLRSAGELLRKGCDEGRVSGLFDVHSPELLASIRQITDANLAEGDEILLTRRLYASGRTSTTLNGQPVTLAMLRQTAELLVDVHGQQDHQLLLQPAHQLSLLDRFGQCEAALAEYQQHYQAMKQAQDRLTELEQGANLRSQQSDLYAFQLGEIDKIDPQPGEMDELTARAAMLGNIDRIKRLCAAAGSALYEADGAIVDRLKGVVGVLQELSELAPSIKDVYEQTREATVALQEAAFDLSRQQSRLELDPAELAEVNDRLSNLQRLAGKYGPGIDEVIAYRDQLRDALEKLRSEEADFSHLRKAIGQHQQEALETGKTLSALRKKAADKLKPMVEKELAELGMERATFRIELSAPETIVSAKSAGQPALLPGGLEVCEFMIRPNPGQEERPLRKVASGGEMSRVMLAIKGLLAGSESVSVLVFDEIDSNVGGRLGAIIGSKLRKLAGGQKAGGGHQVLCITHLPQIACYANRHLSVRKVSDGKDTHTTVRVLEGEERLAEIAEMIGGTKITDVTRAQARELLAVAEASDNHAKADKASASADKSKTKQVDKNKPAKKR